MSRSVGGLWDRIVDWSNIQFAAHAAATGKRYREATLKFFANLDQNTANMISDLERGSYQVGDYERFVVHDPKRREIHAPSFRDRVLHHALLNHCEAEFERRMIFDSYACRRGKGQHAAIKRATRFAKRHRFFLKMDIRRFFNSIDQFIVGTQLAGVFRESELLRVFDAILHSYHTSPGKGLPIGALTSQFLANSYLNPLDRLVKEDLKQKGYVRYMDDFVVWSDSSQHLQSVQHRVTEFLRNELELELKPEPYIQQSRIGMDFLGFRVFPGWIELSQSSRWRFERKTQHYLLAEMHGYSEDELQRRLEALFAHAQFAKSWHFRRRVLEQCEGQAERSRLGAEPGEPGR
ncbi:MAG: reverse transcriptase/maturase family protein [Planctomycetota bacterium]|nr:reverse transcriptase/maturase family protein [Planctomycetota bacterium]